IKSTTCYPKVSFFPPPELPPGCQKLRVSGLTRPAALSIDWRLENSGFFCPEFVPCPIVRDSCSKVGSVRSSFRFLSFQDIAVLSGGRCMIRLVRKAVSESVPLILVLLGLSGSALMGQVQTIGQWSTMSQTMPINPIHVTLLANGKILVVAGSGNCPPSLPGCPSGPPYGPSNNSGAAVFDPSTGTITQLSVSWDMFCNA